MNPLVTLPVASPLAGAIDVTAALAPWGLALGVLVALCGVALVVQRDPRLRRADGLFEDRGREEIPLRDPVSSSAAA